MSDRRELRAGDNSTNVQAQSVYLGSSYLEVRAMVEDLFRLNFPKLRGEAVQAAEERATRVTGEFFEELQSKNPSAIENAREPDMQRALYNVQEAAALQGDQDLDAVLVDMLVDRTGETGRSLRQLVLNEALVTAPKLTHEQINTLAIMFYLRRVVHRPTHGEGFALPPGSLKGLFSEYLDFDYGTYCRSHDDFRHLEYAGCVSISIGGNPAESVLLQKYPAEFFYPLDASEVPTHLHRAFYRVGDALTPACDFSNADILPVLGVSGEHAPELQSLVATKRMAGADVVAHVSDTGSRARSILELWDQTAMTNCSLTSVGLAIGHAKMRRSTNFDAGLDVFLGTH